MAMFTAQANGAGRTKVAPPKRGAISKFFSDLVTLGELQWEMVQAEASKDVRQLVLPLVGIVAAVCLSLATLPVLLLAVAWYIHDTWQWNLPLSLAVTAGSALLLSGLILVAFKLRLSQLPPFFAQSRGEWSKNCAWAKHQLASRND